MAYALTEFFNTVRATNDFKSSVRLLWFQYKALKSGVFKTVLREQLIGLVNTYFGGMFARGASVDKALESALIEHLVITSAGKTPAIVHAAIPASDKEVRVQINIQIEQALQALFLLVESNLNNRSALIRLYSFIEQLNGSLMPQIAPDPIAMGTVINEILKTQAASDEPRARVILAQVRDHLAPSEAASAGVSFRP